MTLDLKKLREIAEKATSLYGRIGDAMSFANHAGDVIALLDRLERAEAIVEIGRLAAAHHSRGYRTTEPWDSIKQLELLDRLGEAIEAFDEYLAKEPA